MSASMSDEASAEPNLTPILDMVFQLITFFMLVINVKNVSIDQTLNLPIVGSAKPPNKEAQKDQIVLNVNGAGELIVYGQKKDVSSYIALEAREALRYVKQTKPNFKAGDELPTTVIIRCDRTTKFKALDNVIKTCQNNGFRKFQFNALNRELPAAGKQS